MRKKCEILGYTIEAELRWQGGDAVVEITGGSKPHIGCVSTCWFHNSEMCAEKFLLPGHRDDVIADKYAAALALQLQTTVCAICGIHYDNVSKEDIALIVAETDKMLSALQYELLEDHKATK